MIFSPTDVKNARVAAGMTQSDCAKRFGYEIRGWQQKEDAGPNGTKLKIGEFNWLLLLAGTHPEFVLQPR